MSRILITDPNPVLRREAHAWVRELGHEALLARDARSAQRVLAANPDVGLLILSSDDDGRSLEATLATLRADPRAAHLPVLLCTWSNRVARLVRLVLLGADRCLQWPVEREEFERAVGELLSTSTLSR